MGVFDLDHKHKCPKCGKEMDYLYGKLLCSDCGYMAVYHLDIKKQTEQIDTSQNVRKGRSQMERDRIAEKSDVKFQENKPQIIRQPQEKISHSRVNKKKIHNQIAGIVLIGAVIIVGVLYVFGMTLGEFTAKTEYTTEDIYVPAMVPDVNVELPELPKEIGELMSQQAIVEVESIVEDGENTDRKEIPARDEQSAGMVEFVEKIFDKPYEEVTEQDYARVGYINFYIYDEVLVTYQITPENGEGYGEYVDIELESTDFEQSDFSAFINLDTLYINEGSLMPIHNLKKLCVLGTNQTPSEIAACVNPQQFISMTFYDLEEADSLKGISAFQNLTSLYLYAGGVEDITELATLKKISNMGLYYVDNVTDFSALNELSAMEFLSINSYSLDDFEFVIHMPMLDTLMLRDSFYADQTQWEYIADATNIKGLYLENCVIPYGVNNYLNMPRLAYLSMVDCVAGMQIEELSYNESIEEIYITGTDFADMSSGVFDAEAEVVLIENYEKKWKTLYPNMARFTCE